MNFALDYDGTYTNDPPLWLEWVKAAIYRGHNVYLVTMRFPSELYTGGDAVDPVLADTLVKQQRLLGQQVIICTSRKAKGPAVAALGVQIHVWIYDNPQAVHMDALQIWGRSSPEGRVVDPKYE